MLKKIGNYYLSIIKKFGVVIPSVVIGAAFLCLLFIDAFDGLTALAHSVRGLYVAIAIIVPAAALGGAIYIALKIKAKELSINDLALACFSAICVLALLMFIFTGAFVGLGLWKWVLCLIALVASLALTFFRVKNID